MKSKLLYIAAILALGVVFSACKKDTPVEPSDEEKQKERLLQTWVLPSPAPAETVTVQGNDVTTDWAAFEITFTDGAYTTTGKPSDLPDADKVWPSSGNWSFAAGDVNTIVRDDGVEVDLLFSETTLTMGFNYTPGGRLDGVEGQWIFKDLVVK